MTLAAERFRNVNAGLASWSGRSLRALPARIDANGALTARRDGSTDVAAG